MARFMRGESMHDRTAAATVGAANESGAPASGVPCWCGVWLPVRDVGMPLDVKDPPVVAEVGWDVDRRGHDGRRGDGRGGLGAGQEVPRRLISSGGIRGGVR
jgi:hypothetical protein